MPHRNLMILLVATVVALVCYVAGEQNPYASHAAQGLAEIEARGLERVANEALFDAAMGAMVDLLRERGDDHSRFISRDQAQEIRDDMRQQFGGIGVRIRFTGEPPKLVVVGAPDPDTPAARAGLRDGDHILAIDDQSTEGISLTDVLRAMRGEPGAAVRLEIQHVDADQSETITLVREVITVDSILGDRRRADGSWEFRLEVDPRIAHVRITAFANRTAGELQNTLDRLAAAGAEAAVLDLRDNGGGALDVAVDICDLLLPSGLTIVEIRGRDGLVHQSYETTDAGRFQDLPVAVVVNHHSASASEIVAACLQDHGRAVVVGQRTFGKGTVQRMIPIEAGKSLLKLTSASYWRPNGRNIHRLNEATDEDDWGVLPDSGFEVPFSKHQYEAFRKLRNDRDLLGITRPEDAATTGKDDPFVDRQLAMAVEHLRGMLNGAR